MAVQSVIRRDADVSTFPRPTPTAAWSAAAFLLSTGLRLGDYHNPLIGRALFTASIFLAIWAVWHSLWFLSLCRQRIGDVPAGALLAGIVGAIWFLLPPDQPKTIAASPSPPSTLSEPRVTLPSVPQSKPRIYLDTNPREIMSLLKSKTDYQASLLVAGYIGKWMELDGDIANVSTQSDGIFAIISYGEKTKSLDRNHVGLVFEASAESKLSAARPGDHIAATCQFDRADMAAVWLNHCELRDGPTPPPR